MWIANLSDKSIVTEEDIPEVPGERKPWQKLLERCRQSDLKITGMRLGVGPALVNSLPPKQCDGYFQATDRIEHMFTHVIKERQGIGSVVGDKVFITWMEVGDNGLTYIYQDVRPLSDCLIHTTLA